jgi:hypothetical protein
MNRKLARNGVPGRRLDTQTLINAVTGEVGPRTRMSGYPTNRELSIQTQLRFDWRL